MPILSKPKHEEFAQLVARGESAGQAYVSAYGPAKGADQSACRLLKNAKIRGRIGELQAEISANLLNASIRERNFRLQQLQNRHDSLMVVIRERAAVLGKLNIHGADMQPPQREDGTRNEPSLCLPAPGAGTGLVCLDWRGKDAVRAVWKVDTGLLAELRAIEHQAAEELGELPGDEAGGKQDVVVNVTFVSPKP